MASMSSLKPAAAALAVQLRHAPSVAAAASSALLRRHIASSTTTRPHGGDVDDGDGRGGSSAVIDNPPPGMAPLPEDAPWQTPPRLGEPDPAGPPLPTTSKDKLGGGLMEGGAGEGAPGGMPDTAPPPDVEMPPVSPDGGSNV